MERFRFCVTVCILGGVREMDERLDFFFINFFLVFLNSLAIFLSYLIINNKNLISALLILILLLIDISFIAFINNAKFLSLLFIIIYVGAVLVLFLFTIMLLGYKEDQKFEKKNFLSFFCFIFLMIYIFLSFENIFGNFFNENLLYFLNLKIQDDFIENFTKNLNINTLYFLENIDKIGFYIFINNSLIIIYSTIILLIGMIASINISKLNNYFLINQQKEIQIKRKIKNSIKLINEL